MAAWDQGKFWEMHDLIFERAPDVDRKVLRGLAQSLKLDMGRYDKAMETMERLPGMKKELDRLHELDIWSTPTVIINGKVLTGAQPYEKYRDAIEEELKKGTSSIFPGRPVPEKARQGLFQQPVRFSSLVLRAALGLLPGEARAEGKVGVCADLFVKVPSARPLNGLQLGDEAPDFTLPTTLDRPVRLSEFRGSKNILLVFLPAAFTPV